MSDPNASKWQPSERDVMLMARRIRARMSLAEKRRTSLAELIAKVQERLDNGQ